MSESELLHLAGIYREKQNQTTATARRIVDAIAALRLQGFDLPFGEGLNHDLDKYERDVEQEHRAHAAVQRADAAIRRGAA